MFMLTINLEIKKTGHSGYTEKRMHVKLDQIDKSVTVIDSSLLQVSNMPSSGQHSCQSGH